MLYLYNIMLISRLIGHLHKKPRMHMNAALNELQQRAETLDYDSVLIIMLCIIIFQIIKLRKQLN